jgi:hypothetical protein
MGRKTSAKQLIPKYFWKFVKMVRGVGVDLANRNRACGPAQPVPDRRIATQEQLKSEIATWEHQRNVSGARSRLSRAVWLSFIEPVPNWSASGR